MELTGMSLCSNVKIYFCVSSVCFSLVNTFWHSAGSCSELEDAGQGGSLHRCVRCHWLMGLQTLQAGYTPGLCITWFYHYSNIPLDWYIADSVSMLGDGAAVLSSSVTGVTAQRTVLLLQSVTCVCVDLWPVTSSKLECLPKWLKTK